MNHGDHGPIKEFASIELSFKKSTRGTHVYENVEEGFPGIYIPRNFFPNQNHAPRFIVVTFNEKETSNG